MISLKVLITAAILALVLPLVTPEPSFAQAPPGARGGARRSPRWSLRRRSSPVWRRRRLSGRRWWRRLPRRWRRTSRRWRCGVPGGGGGGGYAYRGGGYRGGYYRRRRLWAAAGAAVAGALIGRRDRLAAVWLWLWLRLARPITTTRYATTARWRSRPLPGRRCRLLRAALPLLRSGIRHLSRL